MNVVPATTISGFVPVLPDDIRTPHDSFPIIKLPDKGI
jgi:hypothetical protein